MSFFSLPFSERDYDPEQFADQELPILIVGTKLVSSIDKAKSRLDKAGVKMYGSWKKNVSPVQC